VLAIVLYIVIRYSNVVLFTMGMVYMFSGIWARAAYGWTRRRRRQPAPGPASGDETPDAEPHSLGRS